MNIIHIIHFITYNIHAKRNVKYVIKYIGRDV